jgi:integrase
MGRNSGGLKVVRPGVWRVDTEMPRLAGESRRRVSRTVNGTEADARVALASLVEAVRSGAATSSDRKTRRSSTSPRKRGSGSIQALGPNRWIVGVEGGPDPVSGERRRYTKVVRGSKETADVALAHLKLTVDRGEVVIATNARSVAAACEMYLAEARTESQTIRTDRSACRRICGSVLPGGRLFGELALARLDWRRIEEMYATWSGHLDPTTQARYASTLSKVLEYAKRCGWMRDNVAAQANRPKVPGHKPDVPIPGEVRVALDRARSVDFTLYAYAMGLATIGCRRSELLAVTVADCDVKNGVITIRASIADGGPGLGTYRKSTKRDDWRDVPLTEQMVEVLEELFSIRRANLDVLGLKAMAPNSFVFSDEPDGSRWMRPDTTSQRWLKVRGDSNVTLAMLRRYVATQLLDTSNGDYRLAASITGNSEETLKRWYDAGPNIDKKRAVVAMSRL